MKSRDKARGRQKGPSRTNRARKRRRKGEIENRKGPYRSKGRDGRRGENINHTKREPTSISGGRATMRREDSGGKK